MTIDKSTLQAAAKRVADRCNRLAEFSDDEIGLTRTFCSPAMRDAHRECESWMKQAGLSCATDAVGNLIGIDLSRDSASTLPESKKPVFMIGSHLDTVVNAGRFDGMLGALLGLGIAEVIRESEIELPFEIHVIGFSEEEGVRFKFPFIGSRGVAGTFDVADFDRLDKDGISVGRALEEFGVDPGQVDGASYADKNIVGFLEAHIEQAVLLQNDDLAVGVVVAIAGQTRATITFEGAAGHAGTVPHDVRRDALAAAAELVLRIEKLGQETEGLFATVGNMIAKPGLSNVISGNADLWLDLRHQHDDQREEAFAKIETAISEIAKSRNVVGAISEVGHTPAVPMDEALTSHLEGSVVELGMVSKPMVSGAGHDAMIMAEIAPACMLFVRCLDGVSHHPDEFVSPDDIEVALSVMVSAVVNFGRSFVENG